MIAGPPIAFPDYSIGNAPTWITVATERDPCLTRALFFLEGSAPWFEVGGLLIGQVWGTLFPNEPSRKTYEVTALGADWLPATGLRTVLPVHPGQWTPAELYATGGRAAREIPCVRMEHGEQIALLVRRVPNCSLLDVRLRAVILTSLTL